METKPVRLPEGIYEAVTELGTAREVDKSTMASFLISAALSQFEGELSDRTRALIVADAFESYSEIYRSWANAEQEERDAIERDFGKIMGLTRELIGVEDLQ